LYLVGQICIKCSILITAGDRGRLQFLPGNDTAVLRHQLESGFAGLSEVNVAFQVQIPPGDQTARLGFVDHERIPLKARLFNLLATNLKHQDFHRGPGIYPSIPIEGVHTEQGFFAGSRGSEEKLLSNGEPSAVPLAIGQIARINLPPILARQ